MDTNNSPYWKIIESNVTPSYNPNGPETPTGNADWQTGGNVINETFPNATPVGNSGGFWGDLVGSIFERGTGAFNSTLANPIPPTMDPSSLIATATGIAGSSVMKKSGIDAKTIENYFGRIIVIILGFIFVAVGLALFKTPIINIPNTVGKAL